MLKVFENSSLCKWRFFNDLFLKFLLCEICPSLGIYFSWSLYGKGHLTECENRVSSSWFGHECVECQIIYSWYFSVLFHKWKNWTKSLKVYSSSKNYILCNSVNIYIKTCIFNDNSLWIHLKHWRQTSMSDLSESQR